MILDIRIMILVVAMAIIFSIACLFLDEIEEWWRKRKDLKNENDENNN